MGVLPRGQLRRGLPAFVFRADATVSHGAGVCALQAELKLGARGGSRDRARRYRACGWGREAAQLPILGATLHPDKVRVEIDVLLVCPFYGICVKTSAGEVVSTPFAVVLHENAEALYHLHAIFAPLFGVNRLVAGRAAVCVLRAVLELGERCRRLGRRTRRCCREVARVLVVGQGVATDAPHRFGFRVR